MYIPGIARDSILLVQGSFKSFLGKEKKIQTKNPQKISIFDIKNVWYCIEIIC
jgi:hypothetical protein